MGVIEERYEQMYEFENDSRLYEFCFKDTRIPMWMYIRAFLIRNVVDRELSIKYGNVLCGNRIKEKLIKKNPINKYITKNPFWSGSKDICFAFWGYGELRQHSDGTVFEEFIMPFLRMFPDNTTTLMSGMICNQYELDCSHPNWKMDDIFSDILRWKNYIGKPHGICAEDKRNIKGLITFLISNCPIKMDRMLEKEIHDKLFQFSLYSKQMTGIFEAYLRIVRPKVVVICCASYPNLFVTSLIQACRNRKVVTAELQHGLVSRYHPYYQHSDYALGSDDCGKMLPDYFLTFGRYWHSHAKLPQKKYVIGYAKTVAASVPENNKILFCADIDFDRYMDFLDELMPVLEKDAEIYFRLHPIYSTKEAKQKFKKYLCYSNFHFADGKDLSYYMDKCRYVVTEGSTVCYEALFMGRIVFALSSECMHGINKLRPVHLIDNASGFMNIWDKRDSLKSENHSEIFDIGYKKNYIRFLKKCGVDTI